MSSRRITLVDWAIAVGVAATLLVAGLLGSHRSGALELLGFGLLIAGGLVLIARRRAPVAVLLVTGACALGHQACGFDVPAIAFLFAVYAAMREGHRLVTVATSATMLVALLLLANVSEDDAVDVFARARSALELAWLIAAGAAGEALRQAERRAGEAERTREETARRRADDERLHIARELHDSLTHQISVVKVQSEAAVHLAQRRGDEVPGALLAIREAGREAARELRSTLGALRDDDANPPRGLDDVEDLVDRFRSSGLDTTLRIEGDRCAVPAAVGRTGYRIVQEALTNVARHAAAATASVRIDYRPATLAIRVDDDGSATPTATPGPGVGLLGMSERVSALGGRLQAAPRSDGGFTVQAELPVDRRS